MKKTDCFKQEHIEAISKVLGATSSILTGSKIGHILEKCGIQDINPSSTKWVRLYNALIEEQNKKQYGNHIIAFIHKAMDPVLYTDSKESYNYLREKLNITLAFSGLNLSEDGKIRNVEKAKTITEAEKRASNLKKDLLTRNVHPDVLKFCRMELLEDNYFHAVLEATKSIANKIREKSGLVNDGADLAKDAFSIGKNNKPRLAINELISDTERGEQTGFMNLLIGLFGTFRNPTAHAEKIYWPISEQDALDILSLVSLVHRKLDNAKRT
jgi:uncharacterized protein (TIGR02391 family)